MLRGILNFSNQEGVIIKMKDQTIEPKGYVRVSDQKLKTDGERRQDIDRQKEKITK